MTTGDLTTRDLIRLATSFPKARARSSEIPPLGEVLPALKKALDSEGELLDNMVLVFGEPIRAGFDILRQVVGEDYSTEYADELWARFGQKGDV